MFLKEEKERKKRGKRRIKKSKSSGNTFTSQSGSRRAGGLGDHALPHQMPMFEGDTHGYGDDETRGGG